MRRLLILINNVNEITNYMSLSDGSAVVKQLKRQKVMQTPLGVDSRDRSKYSDRGNFLHVRSKLQVNTRHQDDITAT